MTCDTRLMGRQTKAERFKEVNESVKRLEAALQLGQVRIIVGPQGGVVFAGWSGAERAFVSDACAYRKLASAGSWALRQAVQKAEAMSGRKVNEKAIAAGVHSHDNGLTWGSH